MKSKTVGASRKKAVPPQPQQVTAFNFKIGDIIKWPSGKKAKVLNISPRGPTAQVRILGWKKAPAEMTLAQLRKVEVVTPHHNAA